MCAHGQIFKNKLLSTFSSCESSGIHLWNCSYHHTEKRNAPPQPHLTFLTISVLGPERNRHGNGQWHTLHCRHRWWQRRRFLWTKEKLHCNIHLKISHNVRHQRLTFQRPTFNQCIFNIFQHFTFHFTFQHFTHLPQMYAAMLPVVRKRNRQ